MPNFLEALLVRDPAHVQFTFFEQGRGHDIRIGDVLLQARRFATLYRERGAKPGDVVLVSLRPGPELIYAFVGALIGGFIPSMMAFPSAKQDPDLFWESHRVLFSHIGGGVFVTYEENVEFVRGHIPDGLLIVCTPDEASRSEPMDEVHRWRDNEVCCLQHSSGTTGLKKGVTLTFDAIRLQVESYATAIALEPGDTICSWLPLYHDMGFITAFLLPMQTGNPVVFMSPFEWTMAPLSLLDLMESYDGRYAWLPNFAFNHIANSAEDDGTPRDLSHVKAFVNCSEPCKDQTFTRFAETLAKWGVRREQLQVSYAMAETVFGVTQTPLGSIPRVVDGIVSTGRPLDGLEVKIAEDGEILVRGSFVFGGYFKAPHLNETIFTDGWYRTGDLGFIDAGEVFVRGRKKDMLIVLGKNFFAHEIEALVSETPGVKPGRAVAFGIYNDAVGSEDAIVVAEADDSVDRGAVRLAIKAELETTIGLVPKKILVVDQGWLVKSTSGKISRKENSESTFGAWEPFNDSGRNCPGGSQHRGSNLRRGC